MRYFLLFLLLFHGLIHLLGFAKAFHLGAVSQLTQSISRTNGMLWLAAAVLFVVTAVLLLLHKDIWWLSAGLAVLLSQYLIFTSWHDARFGTIANALIVLATIIGFGTWSFYHQYKTEVNAELKQTAAIEASLLTETDLQPLPEPVQRYLRYAGVVGKPKVNNFKVVFSGQIRKDEQSEWMPFESEQHNFLETATRLFFMKATMKHLPVAGFHCFKNGEAFMDIRLLSLVKVQYQSGKEMGIAETVTFFNDMCCMAPATLIDPRIKWLETDSNTVKASFTNIGITISAWLYFNDKGELINFVSDDRFAAGENNTMRRIPWSTPLKDYQLVNGYHLAGYADAIYKYPEGDLTYGTFRLTNIEYNVE